MAHVGIAFRLGQGLAKALKTDLTPAVCNANAKQTQSAHGQHNSATYSTYKTKVERFWEQPELELTCLVGFTGNPKRKPLFWGVQQWGFPNSIYLVFPIKGKMEPQMEFQGSPPSPNSIFEGSFGHGASCKRASIICSLVSSKLTWLWWSKPFWDHPFWLVGEFTTHFRTYFSGWIGMFTGG